jgi:3-oxoacyl-[acyl-carrier protein] reductase
MTATPAPLHNQVVIVTGASRGLGRTTALALAEAGAHVIVTARNAEPDDANSIHATAERIEAQGGSAMAVAVDVSDQLNILNMVREVLARYGRIDALINNAGLMGGELTFTEVTPAFWREIITTNLWGAFLCCQAILPAMLRQSSGVIVNITSGAAVRTGFLNIPYGVSKAGLDRLTLGMADELKDNGIACVSLSPPVSATDTVRAIYPDQRVEDWAAPPEHTAQAICRLLERGDAQRYSGQVVSVSEYLQNTG